MRRKQCHYDRLSSNQINEPDECAGIGKLLVGATDEFDDVADGYAVFDDDDEQNKSLDSKKKFE